MITVYSRPGCVQCTATCRALDRQSVSYQLVDIEQDEAARVKLRDLGYQSLPVVVTPSEHWSGFRPEKIAALSA